MAGYTRQSVFVDGDTATASIFNAEYNQLAGAFNSLTGHKHDGTSAEGALVPLISGAGGLNKVQINDGASSIDLYVNGSRVVRANATSVIPETTNTIDLGSSSVRFKDGYFAGTLYPAAISGWTIGTDVQAYSPALQSISGLTTSANQMIYTTGANTYATASITSYGRSLVSSADASAARTTLGATATGGAVFTASSQSAARTSIGATTIGATIFTAADASAVRTAIGGTTVGTNLYTLPNPSAIRFLRVNADNSVSALSASDFRQAIDTGPSVITVLNSSGTSFLVGNF